MDIEVRNCAYSKPDNSMVDCEINHPDYGWIPTSVLVEGDDRPELALLVSTMEKSAYIEPEISVEQKIKNIEVAVQSLHDAEAAKRGYDDINSCGKYVGYPNDFREESEALGGWAASCWTKCYLLLSDWQDGVIGEMTPDQVLEAMPELVL